MKFTLLLLFCFFAAFCTTLAEQVHPDKALQVANSFYNSKIGSTQADKKVKSLTLVYTCASQQQMAQAKISPITYYYVFNADPGSGFVVVAGDDIARPILGYSFSGSFDHANLPSNVAKWLEGYRSEIRHYIETNEQSDPETKQEWQQLLEGSGLRTSSVQAVAPLVATRWDQSPYVNDLCPMDTEYNDRAVTGCGATAMAQIMKYWNYPATGTGFHSYTHPRYGVLSANFGGTTYNWDAMPNTVTSPNLAVATLMYHCGVASNMEYGVAATGGSISYLFRNDGGPSVKSAFLNHFGYDSETMQVLDRNHYPNANWIQMLKNELAARRPIFYRGAGTGGGHFFICDGYDNNDFFHMNWGWGGSYDGYFAINALNPQGIGTGGGTGGFNSGHYAIIGIQPPPNTNPQGAVSLSLYDFVEVTPTNIQLGQPFSVHTDVLAVGEGTFKGDVCAAVFDENSAFVDFVEILKIESLPSNYHFNGGITFSTDGLESLLPGNYTIGIYYRPEGGEWVQAASSGNFVNMVPVKVVKASEVELYAEIRVVNESNVVQGQPITVMLDIANFGATEFKGNLDLSFYKLDGEWVTTLERKSNMSLPPNSHYRDGLSFQAEAANVEPGTYWLALAHQKSGGEWELTGSSSYPNPIKVIVREPALLADTYEPNDSHTEAYQLPVSFNGNNARVVTSGSNTHQGTDYDYYKLELADGYNYTITARVHDSYNSGNGQTYTCDVLFSYFYGSGWSDAYDDVMPTDITLSGGGLMYLRIAPFFQGHTGTYALDLQITRSTVTSTEEAAESNLVTVYPNPAKDYVKLDIDQKIKEVQAINILDLTGRKVSSVAPGKINKSNAAIPLQYLPEGIYILSVETNEGIFRKKFSKTR